MIVLKQTSLSQVHLLCTKQKKKKKTLKLLTKLLFYPITGMNTA